MTINNFKCLDCDKQGVCIWYTVLDKFNENNKKFIPIEITINNCPEFKVVED